MNDHDRSDGQKAVRVRVERDGAWYRIGRVGTPLKPYRRVTRFSGSLPKPWLSRWAAKEVATFAVQHKDRWEGLGERDAVKFLKGSPWSKRDDAADRGTAVHRAIESVVTGRELPDLSEEELECAIQAETFLERFAREIHASELTVFSPRYEYAGTLDLWLTGSDRSRWILDAKTSSSDSIPYVDWTIQQAAYRMAEYAVVDKREVGEEVWEGRVIPWGPERADRLGILHIGPEQATLYPIQWTDAMWSVFRAAKHIREFQDATDDYRKDPEITVYGDPVRMTGEEVPA